MPVGNPTLAQGPEVMTACLASEVDRCARYFHSFSLLRFDVHAAGPGELERLVSILRPSDTVAQLGERDFCILLPEAMLDTAQMVAERVSRWVARGNLSAAGETQRPRVNVGIAGFEGRDDTASAILERATSALNAACAGDGGRIATMSRHGVMVMTDVP